MRAEEGSRYAKTQISRSELRSGPAAIAAAARFGILGGVANVKQAIRELGVAMIGKFGTLISDCETGRPLGRALLIPWRGKIHVIGLGPAVRPMFLPQTRLTYWKQELGFTVHPPVDFPTERRVSSEKPVAP